MRFSIEPITRKYLIGYGSLLFSRTVSKKIRKELLDTAKKAGLDAINTYSKKLVHKTT